ncbi:hypothetical protein AM218_10640 [Hymenobacter sp. DG25A]|nr:hypothetical protein AM218_10640 [Hymenobacter sp. DG25A]
MQGNIVSAKHHHYAQHSSIGGPAQPGPYRRAHPICLADKPGTYPTIKIGSGLGSWLGTPLAQQIFPFFIGIWASG